MVENFKIKNFRGVFMKDQLPNKIWNKECGIVNLQSAKSYGNGTHWVAYFYTPNKKYYFDSYSFTPPLEIVKYLGEKKLFYNEYPIQNEKDPPICGHLCLLVLKNLSEGKKYDDALLIKCKSKDLFKYFLT